MSLRQKIMRLACSDDVGRFFALRNNIVNCPNRSLRRLMKPVWRIRYQKLCVKYGAGIPLSANIGKSTTFPHSLYGIFVSMGATIGEGCVIFHQVTIGSNTLANSRKYGAPTIGNNVYIGAGAKIIGNVKIGNNVRIGANAVVVQDVPDNATVVLTSPRVIIHEESRDNSFHSFHKS